MGRCYGRWLWNFPRHREAHRADWAEMNSQLRKILEEVKETNAEVRSHNAFAACEECMDIIHACETLLVMIAGPDDAYLTSVKRAVIEKNDRRGYYDAD